MTRGRQRICKRKGERIRRVPARAYSAARISSNSIPDKLSGLPDKLSGSRISSCGFPDRLSELPDRLSAYNQNSLPDRLSTFFFSRAGSPLERWQPRAYSVLPDRLFSEDLGTSPPVRRSPGPPVHRSTGRRLPAAGRGGGPPPPVKTRGGPPPVFEGGGPPPRLKPGGVPPPVFEGGGPPPG